MIRKIFTEIAGECSTNKKMDILRSYKDVPLLKEVLYAANSKRVKYFIKQIPQYEQLGTHIHPLGGALEALTLLSERKLTGGLAVKHLSEVLALCVPDDAYIIERIIEKDCKIGMGTSNMNKVFPNLIEKTPYMGAKAYEKKLVESILSKGSNHLSQIKMDGRYCNALVRGDETELESRQGETTHLVGAKFLEELKGLPDCVLNGELTMDGISRYESNGIIASLVSIGKKKKEGEDISKEMAKIKERHMDYQEALDKIVFTVWDSITIDEYFQTKSSVPYETRLANVTKLLNDANTSQIRLINSVVVNSYDEAMEHFQTALKNGQEGTVLKSSTGAWKDGKPNWQVKLKKEINLDLKIVGFNYGTGKNKELISSFNVESSDGLLKTSPTGITEGDMKFITESQDKLMNTIIEVKCSGLSQNSDKNYSVLHPVFIKFRDDKTEANSLEECIEIDKASMAL